MAVGLYRFIRDPLYIGVGLVLLYEGLWFESYRILIFLVCAWAAAYLCVVLYEEPALRGKSGGDYEEYCRTVPR